MAESVVQPLSRPQAANKRLKFLIGGILILAAVAYLTISALGSTSSYYRTPAEVLAQHDQLVGKPLRVSGKLLVDTIQWNAKDLKLDFVITDDTGARLPIHFEGVKPDNMTEAAEVIVEGKLDPNGVVQANSLLLKCPSRYEEGKMTEVRVQSPATK